MKNSCPKKGRNFQKDKAPQSLQQNKLKTVTYQLAWMLHLEIQPAIWVPITQPIAKPYLSPLICSPSIWGDLLDGHYVSCQGESAGGRLLATFNTKGLHRQLSLHFPPGSYNFYLFLENNPDYQSANLQKRRSVHNIGTWDFQNLSCKGRTSVLNNRHHSNVTKPEMVSDGVAKYRKNCECCPGRDFLFRRQSW